MTLPTFDDTGQLPPGKHEATWEELVSRFGHTAERQVLLSKLWQALAILASVGCRRVWLNGSFVTDIERIEGVPPGDVDVAWDLTDVDLDGLINLAPAMNPFRANRSAQQRQFGGDYIGALETDDADEVGILGFFQRTRSGQAKGIVVLLLNERGPT